MGVPLVRYGVYRDLSAWTMLGFVRKSISMHILLSYIECVFAISIFLGWLAIAHIRNGFSHQANTGCVERALTAYRNTTKGLP